MNRLDEPIFMAVPKPMLDWRIVDGFWLTLLSHRGEDTEYFRLIVNLDMNVILSFPKRP